MTSYLLSVNVTHENEQNKNGRLYNMLKHYFCKYTIDRDTLFGVVIRCRSSVDTLVCVHLLLFYLTNFALCFTLVHLSFPPSCFGFPSITWVCLGLGQMFWNLAVLRITKGLSTLILIRDGAYMSHVHLFFILLYFCWKKKYRIKIHV